MALVSCGNYEMSDDVGRPDAGRKTATEIPLDEALSALDRFFESAGETTRGSHRIIGNVSSVTSFDMFGAQNRGGENNPYIVGALVRDYTQRRTIQLDQKQIYDCS